MKLSSRKKLRIERIVHSGLERAIETAAIVNNALKPPQQLERCELLNEGQPLEVSIDTFPLPLHTHNGDYGGNLLEGF